MFKRKIRRSREWSRNNREIDFEKAQEARRKKREALTGNAEGGETLKNAEASMRKISKKSRKRNFYTAMTVVVLVVTGFSVFNIVSVNSQFAEAVAEREGLVKEKERLTYELKYVDSVEYLEQEARALLKMIKPGEVFFIMPEGPPENE